MLLEVRDMRVSYGNVLAVNGVSLNVEEGSIVTVLGANGAGKTSLLNAILGVARGTGRSSIRRTDDIRGGPLRGAFPRVWRLCRKGAGFCCL